MAASVKMQFALDFTAQLPAETQERIAEGMARVDQNADEKWKHIFDCCVLAAARRLPEITVDDVLDEMEKLPNAPSTHNLAAIGPAMKRAFEMGVLQRTDRVKRSRRGIKHGNRHNVWGSRCFS